MSRQPSDSDNEDGGHDNRVRGTAEHDDGAVSPRADSTSPHSAVMDGTFDSAAADSFDVSMQSGAGRDDSMASAGGRGRRRGSYAARRDSITTNMHMAAEIGQMLLEKNQELEQERDELLRDMEHLRDRIDTLGHELAVTREGGHTFQARIESLQQDNLRLSLALAHAEQASLNDTRVGTGADDDTVPKEEHDHAVARALSLEADVERLRRENAELSARLEEGSAQIESRDQQLATLTESRRRSQDRRDDAAVAAQEALIDHRRQLRSAEQRVKDLESTCEEQEAEILRLREEVEEVEASNQHLVGVLSEKEDMIESLRTSTMLQAQTDVADDVDAEAAVATVMLHNEIAELTTRCHELSDENESLKRTVAQLSASPAWSRDSRFNGPGDTPDGAAAIGVSPVAARSASGAGDGNHNSGTVTGTDNGNGTGDSAGSVADGLPEGNVRGASHGSVASSQPQPQTPDATPPPAVPPSSPSPPPMPPASAAGTTTPPPPPPPPPPPLVAASASNGSREPATTEEGDTAATVDDAVDGAVDGDVAGSDTAEAGAGTTAQDDAVAATPAAPQRVPSTLSPSAESPMASMSHAIDPQTQLFRLQKESVKGFATLDRLSPRADRARARKSQQGAIPAAAVSGGGEHTGSGDEDLRFDRRRQEREAAATTSSRGLPSLSSLDSGQPFHGIGLTNTIRTELWMRYITKGLAALLSLSPDAIDGLMWSHALAGDASHTAPAPGSPPNRDRRGGAARRKLDLRSPGGASTRSAATAATAIAGSPDGSGLGSAPDGESKARARSGSVVSTSSSDGDASLGDEGGASAGPGVAGLPPLRRGRGRNNKPTRSSKPPKAARKDISRLWRMLVQSDPEVGTLVTAFTKQAESVMVASAPGQGTGDAGVERATAVMHEIDAKWRDSAQRTGGIVVGFLRGLIHHYRRQWALALSMIAGLAMGTPPVHPDWIPDSDCHSCVGCRNAFGPFRRKHHCRACGRIFCYACSSKEFDMATVVVGAARGASTDPRRPRRVCDTCFNVLSIFVRSVIDDKRKRKARARRAKSRPNRRSAGASAPPPAAALSERSSSRGRVVPAKSINGPAGNTPRAAR